MRRPVRDRQPPEARMLDVTDDQLRTLRVVLHKLCRIGQNRADLTRLGDWSNKALQRLVASGVLIGGDGQYGIGPDRAFALLAITEMNPAQLSLLFVETEEFEQKMRELRGRQIASEESLSWVSRESVRERLVDKLMAETEKPLKVKTADQIIAEANGEEPEDDVMAEAERAFGGGENSNERMERLKKMDIFRMPVDDRVALTAYQVMSLRSEVADYFTTLAEQVIQPTIDGLNQKVDGLATSVTTLVGAVERLRASVDEIVEVNRDIEIVEAIEAVVVQLKGRPASAENDVTAAAPREEMVASITKGITAAIDRRTQIIARSSDPLLLEALQRCAPDLDRFGWLVTQYNKLRPKLTEKWKAIGEQQIAIAAPTSIKKTPNWMTDHLDAVDPNLIKVRQAMLAHGEGMDPLWEALEDGLTYNDVLTITHSAEIDPKATKSEMAETYKKMVVDYRARKGSAR